VGLPPTEKHRLVTAHEVTCVYGKPFPPCNKCGHHVRFKLKYKAIHIESHEHFKK
jgi:hypothetical protein